MRRLGEVFLLQQGHHVHGTDRPRGGLQEVVHLVAEGAEELDLRSQRVLY